MNLHGRAAEKWLSPAKVNWYLRVLDRRADGYHNIETVFHELAFADELEFHPIPEPVCRIEGFSEDIPVERNLIYRAWDLLRLAAPGTIGGFRIIVRKYLPSGGGLGGGSSNAAVTIRALVRICSAPVATSEIQALALKLGSDVPFFLTGGCAVGRGRGEILTPVCASNPIPLVLLFPREKSLTAEAYGRLSTLPRQRPAGPLEELCGAVCKGDVARLAPLIHNDFEAVVAEADWFKRARTALEKAGSPRAFLCGSGSTIAALAEDMDHARNMVRNLHESYDVRVTQSGSVPLTGD